MNIRHSLLVALFSFLAIANCKGQAEKVYEIPFSLDKKLLVFKGRLNGVETNFAFDTGAAEGIANTNNEKNKGVERKNSTQRISDADGKTAYLQKAVTEKLSVGGFTFENVGASFTDMPYLYCMDLYLLGADVIRKLNWEIDFNKMVLKVSKNRFETTANMTSIPVKYEYNTPRTKITIQETTYKDVLIDFGFSGVMTIPGTDKAIKRLLDTKRQQHLVTSKMTSSFTATGMSKPYLTEIITIDSIKINDHYYQNIPADCISNTDFKIGLSFFSSTCEKVIINNDENKYYLALKPVSTFKTAFPVTVLLQDGVLKTSSVTITENPAAHTFTIGEVIQSLNGKTASDFANDCDFLTWYYNNVSKWDKLSIETGDGQQIEVTRSPNR